MRPVRTAIVPTPRGCANYALVQSPFVPSAGSIAMLGGPWQPHAERGGLPYWESVSHHLTIDSERPPR